jgi:hypothetical protein
MNGSSQARKALPSLADMVRPSRPRGYAIVAGRVYRGNRAATGVDWLAKSESGAPCEEPVRGRSSRSGLMPSRWSLQLMLLALTMAAYEIERMKRLMDSPPSGLPYAQPTHPGCSVLFTIASSMPVGPRRPMRRRIRRSSARVPSCERSRRPQKRGRLPIG